MEKIDLNGRHVGKSRFFTGEGFVRNILLLAGGTAIGQGAIVLVSPVLTWLYSPEDFGVLSIYGSILSLLLVICSLRYELAIPLPEDEETAFDLLTVSFLVLTGLSVLTGFGVWLLGDKVAKGFNISEVAGYLWLIPISLFGAGSYQVLSYWAMRRKEYSRIAYTKVSKSIGQIVLQLLLGFWKPGALSLLIGDSFGRVSGCGTILTPFFKKDRKRLKTVNVSRIWQAAVRYRKFPLLSSGSAFLNTISLQATPILLGWLFSSQVVGWYALTQRVMALPLSMIGTAVAQAFVGESAEIAKTAPLTMMSFFWRTLRMMSLIGIPMVAIACLCAPWCFSFVFGPAWANSGVYLQILSPLFLLQFILSSSGNILDILERQDLLMMREMARIILLAACVVIARVLHFDSLSTLILFSISGTIGYLIHGFTSWYAIVKFVRGTVTVQTS